MKCLFCGCEESKVLDSRSVDETNAIRRRRECLGCGKRFTTYEMVETSPKTPAVLKKEVCSPGGTTIEALAVFDENNMDVTIKKGIDACIAKSKKLSE